MKQSTNPCTVSSRSSQNRRLPVVINQKLIQNNDHASIAIAHAYDVLRDLHALLDDYAPMWFTEVHHKRAERALYELNRLVPSRRNLSLVGR